MKKLALLPIAALAFTAACDDTKSPVAPSDANFELVDKTIRVDASQVNAHVCGTFTVTVPGTPGYVLGMEGVVAGRVPGNSKPLGTCDTGMWFNPQTKKTAGSESKPHPHCFVPGTEDLEIVLEPISVAWGNPGQSDNEFLRFTSGEDGAKVKFVGAGNSDPTGNGNGNGNNDSETKSHTKGDGVIEAYAILASTLGTTNQRVGIITIDLATEFTKQDGNMFSSDCTFGTDAVRCLPEIITASYRPLTVGGLGLAADAVTGQLWWAAADKPFNYSDMP